ncbi:MAG: hypothetical protein GY799_04515 [Desulfobulbaceae bacterium]|nr:hypothetical protein [Desulfobulbaceae bacterium]
MSFKIMLYEGTGEELSINGLGFQPDLLWFKERDGPNWNYVFDSVRGVLLRISSNESVQEDGIIDSLISFDSDGFTIGAASQINALGFNYVVWCIEAGTPGVTDATQTESYSTVSGLSVIKSVGDGIAGRVLTHSLGVVPTRVYGKRLDSAADWVVYDVTVGNTDYLVLNDTDAQVDDDTMWYDTTPNTTTVTLGDNDAVNANLGGYIFYILADTISVSETGSYTGNGDTTGPIISTDFGPMWFIGKRTDAAGPWVIIDVGRSPENPRTNSLLANDPAAESDDTYSMAFNPLGFQILTDDADLNADGGEYVYQIAADFAISSAENIFIQNNVAQLNEPDIDGLRTLGDVDAETMCYVNDSGVFYYDPTSTATDNNTTVIQPTGVTTGRWLFTHDPEFASDAETATGTSTVKVITPESLASMVLGSPEWLFVWNSATEPVQAIGGAWTALSFPTFGVNRIGGAIENDNRNFTLPAGTYQIYALNTGSDCDNHVLRVWSVTGATDLTYGGLERAEVGQISTVKMFQGLVLASETTIQIQYRFALAGNLGATPPEGITTYPQAQLLIGRFA